MWTVFLDNIRNLHIPCNKQFTLDSDENFRSQRRFVNFCYIFIKLIVE